MSAAEYRKIIAVDFDGTLAVTQFPTIIEPKWNEIAICKALKKQGFKFVGPVCVYSFLEAAGLINDHESDCDWK